MKNTALEALRSELAAVKSDRRSLRSFGIVMGAALGAITIIAAWKNDWTLARSVVLLGSGCIGFAVFALVAPTLLRPVHRVWMAIAIVLGYVMTRLILGVVFFLIITPTGVLLRLIGKDPLAKGPDPSLRSYWITKTYQPRDTRRLEKYY